MSKAGFRKIYGKIPQGLCCGYPPPIPEELLDEGTDSPEDHEDSEEPNP